MNVALTEVLALIGRLDDAPGHDTPRERFRRFLIEHVAEPATLFSLIGQGQHTPGEQPRRAVQDALVVLGRILGFETSFGSYERVAGALKFEGLWRSRHRVEMTLDVRAHDAAQAPVDLEDLTRSLTALPAFSRRDTDTRVLGLCIVTPLYGDRARLDEAVAARTRQGDIRIVSIRSLLWLAEAVHAGRVRHEEVVRLITAENTDFLVDLMARIGAGAVPGAVPPEASQAEPLAPSAAVPAPPALAVVVPATPARDAVDPAHWLVTIEADDRTTPEQFVDTVIGRRRLLGVRSGDASTRPHAGDWICFSIRGKGIVGHGQVDAMADAPPPLRDAHRFSAVFGLKNVELYAVPRAAGPDARADRPVDPLGESAGPLVTSLSAEEFATFTAQAAKGRRTGLRSAS